MNVTSWLTHDDAKQATEAHGAGNLNKLGACLLQVVTYTGNIRTEVHIIVEESHSSASQWYQLLYVHVTSSRDNPTREVHRTPANRQYYTPALVRATYDAIPGVHRGSKSISFPLASVAFMKSKTASIEAIADHRLASAIWRPTHMRRPHPQTGVTWSSFRSPEDVKNRSGLNSNGAGYLVASCVIALWRQ